MIKTKLSLWTLSIKFNSIMANSGLKWPIWHIICDNIMIRSFNSMFTPLYSFPGYQFAGYNEDILDIKYLGLESSHIAVATNSELITVFELSTRSCQILSGHTDIVMALDVHKKGRLMVSGSKVNIWFTLPERYVYSCYCLQVWAFL